MVLPAYGNLCMDLHSMKTVKKEICFSFYKTLDIWQSNCKHDTLQVIPKDLRDGNDVLIEHYS